VGIAVGVLTAGEVTEGVDVAVGALVALGVCVAEAVADGRVVSPAPPPQALSVKLAPKRIRIFFIIEI